MKYPDNQHTGKLYVGKLRTGLCSAVKPALNLFTLLIVLSIATPVGTASAIPATTSTVSGAAPATVKAPRLSEQQAISSVFNRVETHRDVRGERIVVNNPHHRVSFAPDGVHFSPRQGPDWHWQLQSNKTSSSKTAQQSAIARQGAVDYIRPGYIERYLLKANTIEQRFILEQPYTAKKDLVIDGAIKSAGQFSTTATGWRWQDDNGAVNLGQVTVFDANGKILPASMHTTAEHSRITVAASVLHTAAYPVTIDPEIGGDIRLSDMGNDGNNNFDAVSPGVAYNSTNNEYLVVWQGDDNTGAQVDGELEIFGQRVNAATGAEIGGDIRLSDMGDDGDSGFDAFNPAVAYNATNNEYLVVWNGDDNTGTLVDNEIEIFGQRVNAATGAEIGDNDFRLSDMGGDGNNGFGAFNSAVAYNATNNEYLVVWNGNDNTGTLVVGENEIFGQRVNAATGAEIGDNDFRLSDMGDDGNTSFTAFASAVAYNSTNNEYLVVWTGDDNTGTLVDGEFEVFGQRVNAATGAEVGDNDFRLSDMGNDGNTNFDADTPAVAYNAANNEYLVVWNGDDNTGALVNDENEIFGQRVNAATGAEVGNNDFRLSDMGNDGNTNFDASSPAVAYNAANNEYLVVWQGDDNTGALVEGESEIFAQRVNAATGVEIGGDTRLSDMGDDGNANFDALNPAVAYNPANNEYLVVWRGDDNSGALVEGEFEVFAQRFAGPATLRFANAAISAAENSGTVLIEVQRVGDTDDDVLVDFDTSDGTATTPADYTTASGTLSFLNGETSKTFEVALIDNAEEDGDKTVNLTLSNPLIDGIEVALDAQASSAALTIEDDDAANVGGGNENGGGSGGGSLNPILLMLLFAAWLVGRRINQQR